MCIFSDIREWKKMLFKYTETTLIIEGILPTLLSVGFDAWSQIAVIISIEKFLELI